MVHYHYPSVYLKRLETLVLLPKQVYGRGLQSK